MLITHRLVLRSSRYLSMALGLLHLAALVGLITLPLPLWLKTTLGAMVVISACFSIFRHALLHAASSIRELVLRDDGKVECGMNKGEWFEAEVSRQSTVLPWFIVMLIRNSDSRQKKSLVIVPDALSPEEWRALRVWLRWKLI